MIFFDILLGCHWSHTKQIVSTDVVTSFKYIPTSLTSGKLEYITECSVCHKYHKKQTAKISKEYYQKIKDEKVIKIQKVKKEMTNGQIFVYILIQLILLIFIFFKFLYIVCSNIHKLDYSSNYCKQNDCFFCGARCKLYKSMNDYDWTPIKEVHDKFWGIT